jgi:hypothetical protein
LNGHGPTLVSGREAGNDFRLWGVRCECATIFINSELKFPPFIPMFAGNQ